MDQFDRKILTALKRDARQSISSIAGQVNLSRSAVSERIRRMEENGDILGYQVLTPPTDAAHPVKAYLEIRQSDFQCNDIASILTLYDEVIHCHGTSGESDIIAYIETASMQRLQEIRQDLDRRLPDNIKAVTHIVMKEW